MSSLWYTIKGLTYWIFYKEPLKGNRRNSLEHQHEALRHYGWIVFLAGFIVPWACLAPWYLLTVYGCASYGARPFLKGLCMRAYSHLDGTTPWCQDLWDFQAAHADRAGTLPPHIEEIMIIHVGICNAETALRQQISKIKEAYFGIVTKETLDSLRKSHASLPPMPSKTDILTKSRSRESYSVRHVYSVGQFLPHFLRGKRHIERSFSYLR